MYGTYKRNQSKDGYMPCCSKCGEPFDDADVGEVKNYPEDGQIAVFFKCGVCKDQYGEPLESNFVYKPVRK